MQCIQSCSYAFCADCAAVQNLRVRSADGYSPLCVALVSCDEELAVRLVRSGQCSLDLADHADGYTALHHATKHSLLDAVHELLQAGADVNKVRLSRLLLWCY